MTARVLLRRASRARWLAARGRYLTATDVPVLFGLSSWRTPLDVWLDKVDPRPRDGMSYVQARGLALEPFIAGQWARDNGAVLDKPPALLGHPTHTRVACSLDYLAHTPTESVVVECKTSSKWEEWLDGDLPDVYAVQALTQAAITGLPVVVVADVNSRIEVRRIEPDPEWEAESLPWLETWWDEFVATRTPPPLHPWRDYPLLNRVWVPEPGEQVDADSTVMGAVEALVRLRERVKELDNIQTGLKTQVRAHMRSAAILAHPDTGRTVAAIDSRGALRVTWKPAQEGETT